MKQPITEHEELKDYLTKINNNVLSEQMKFLNKGVAETAALTAQTILQTEHDKEMIEFSDWTSANAVYKGNSKYIYYGILVEAKELLDLFRKEQGNE